jgi:galactonate dehydratase
LELVTDSGLVGLSEARMVKKTDTLLAAVGELGSRHVLGKDPFDVEALVETIERLEYGRPGEVAETALALIEIAREMCEVRRS